MIIRLLLSILDNYWLAPGRETGGRGSHPIVSAYQTGENRRDSIPPARSCGVRGCPRASLILAAFRVKGGPFSTCMGNLPGRVKTSGQIRRTRGFRNTLAGSLGHAMSPHFLWVGGENRGDLSLSLDVESEILSHHSAPAQPHTLPRQHHLAHQKSACPFG